MPICPKCGKSLSSEQALAYHLNRKFKCGTWKCVKCFKQFDTKFDLNIHEMNCISQRIDCPSYNILRLFYIHSNVIFYNLDEFDKIKSISPQFNKEFMLQYEDFIGEIYENTHVNNVRNNIKFKSKLIKNDIYTLVFEYI